MSSERRDQDTADGELTISDRFEELEHDILRIHERLDLGMRKFDADTSAESLPETLAWTLDTLSGLLTAVRELRDAVDERTSAY